MVLKKLTERFRKMKLMSRIFLINMCLIIAAFAALVTIIGNNLTNEYVMSNLDFNESAVSNLRQYMVQKEDFIVKTIRLGHEYKDMYSSIYDFLDKNWTEETVTEQKIEFTNYIQQRFGIDKDMTGLLIYEPEEDIVYAVTRMNNYEFQSDEPCFNELREFYDVDTTKVYITPSIVSEFLKARPSYSLKLNIRSVHSFNKIASLQIDFSIDSITDYLNQYYSGAKGNFLILTNIGEVIYDSTESFYGEIYPYIEELKLEEGERSSYLEKIDNESYYLNKRVIDYMDLFIIGMIPENELLKSEKETIHYIYYASIGILAVLGSFLYYNTRVRAKRIEKIRNAMLAAQKGDLHVEIIKDNVQDELYDISQSFNDMCRELDNYIQKVYKSEIQKKQFQILALQAQINPHFLYNTLEAIRMKALADDEKEIAEMIYILSKLFRNSIKEGGITTIKQELDNCKNYLKLYEIRFENQLHYEFDVEDIIIQYGAIRHMLQPLVENYFLHAFDSSRMDNFIEIKAKKENEFICFIIRDNGTGMDEDTLNKIQAQMNNMEEINVRSIGLANINQRIKLIYGMECGLTIHSEYGVGTVLIMKIRAKGERELM